MGAALRKGTAALGYLKTRGVARTPRGERLLYNEHIESFEMEQVLSLTRAWTLIRFFDAKLLQSARCTCCGGEFVAHAFDPTHNYVCGLCHIPSRAGKTRRAQAGAEAEAS